MSRHKELLKMREDLIEMSQDKWNWKAPLDVCEFQNKLLDYIEKLEKRLNIK